MLAALSPASQRWKWLFMLKDCCRFGVYAAETISLATQTGVIRSVDSPSTVFLTALVNIELNSLLCKTLMTSHNIFTWLHSSCVKATTISWKLRNLINYDSLLFASDGIVLVALIQACYYLCGMDPDFVPNGNIYLIHSSKKLGYHILILSETSVTKALRDLLYFTRYSSFFRTAHASSLFSSICLEK